MKERKERTRKYVEEAKVAIQRTGQLSAVCKIPRHGTKSTVVIANVHSDDMNLIPNTLETYKYSYKKANPRTVQMAVVATPRRTLNSNKETDVVKDINTHKNLGIVHKLLGIHFKINGDTSQTGKLL